MISSSPISFSPLSGPPVYEFSIFTLDYVSYGQPYVETTIDNRFNLFTLDYVSYGQPFVIRLNDVDPPPTEPQVSVSAFSWSFFVSPIQYISKQSTLSPIRATL